MAGLGLLTLLDDITALLDDVAVMTKTAAGKSTAMLDDVAMQTKVAMQKTAGVLGDDLALNAEQVIGVKANRELPVVWAVAKGSMLNKTALVPAALLISAFAPWLITPLLMLGGAFLCFEGVEKVLGLFHKKKAHATDPATLAAQAAQAAQHGVAPSAIRATEDTPKTPEEYEKEKISGAIRTDFILSAEILAIALGTVSTKPLMEQFAVLVAVAIAITVFVYGLVAVIVRMDDAGLWLQTKSSAALQALGRGLIAFAPKLMRLLSIVGTAAMFMVGGSLLVHGIAPIQGWIDSALIPQGGFAAAVLPVLVHVVVGFAIGAVIVALLHAWHKVRGTEPAH